jgi:hypothetical protein
MLYNNVHHQYLVVLLFMYDCTINCDTPIQCLFVGNRNSARAYTSFETKVVRSSITFIYVRP